MKIVTVVGARPQLIKAAAVSRVVRQTHQEFLVHTGQHYDYGMSEIFFRELGIPEPDINLGIGSGTHGTQTGAMLAAIEPLIERERPDWVVVYGDTNSTLAGALAAAKLHVPVAHVEAGVRSGNWRMPEEINRVLTDAAADLLLAPTQTAMGHLEREHVHGRVAWVGDVMLDAFELFGPAADARPVLARLGGLEPGSYAVATVHRAENVDDAATLECILRGLGAIEMPVILPLHPRTRRRIGEFGLDALLADKGARAGARAGAGTEQGAAGGVAGPGVWAVDPLGYLDMMALVRGSRLVLTDSGGLQKEAAFCRVPCVTLREESEWPETVEAGWNALTGSDPERMAAAARAAPGAVRQPVENLLARFGGGRAAQRVADALAAQLRP